MNQKFFYGFQLQFYDKTAMQEDISENSLSECVSLIVICAVIDGTQR